MTASVLKEAADKAGVSVATLRVAAEAVAKELDGLSRKSSTKRPPWFSLVCEQVANSLRDGLDSDKGGRRND